MLDSATLPVRCRGRWTLSAAWTARSAPVKPPAFRSFRLTIRAAPSRAWASTACAVKMPSSARMGTDEAPGGGGGGGGGRGWGGRGGARGPGPGGEGEGAGDVPRLVGVGAEVALRAHGLADLQGRGDVALDGRRAHLELEEGEALAQARRGLARVGRGVGVAQVPEEARGLAGAAAQELVDGRAEGLARQVEQGDLDGRLRAVVAEQPPGHGRAPRLAPQRVLAEEGGREDAGDRRRDRRLRLAREGRRRRALAPAQEARVRADRKSTR